MKRTILIISILLGGFICKGQGGSISKEGYYEETTIMDTVKITMLVTTCDTCVSKAIAGYAIRKLYNYIGMSWTYIGNSDTMIKEDRDEHRTIGYLDQRKKPLPKTTIIWQVK